MNCADDNKSSSGESTEFNPEYIRLNYSAAPNNALVFSPKLTAKSNATKSKKQENLNHVPEVLDGFKLGGSVKSDPQTDKHKSCPMIFSAHEHIDPKKLSTGSSKTSGSPGSPKVSVSPNKYSPGSGRKASKGRTQERKNARDKKHSFVL